MPLKNIRIFTFIFIISCSYKSKNLKCWKFLKNFYKKFKSKNKENPQNSISNPSANNPKIENLQPLKLKRSSMFDRLEFLGYDKKSNFDKSTS